MKLYPYQQQAVDYHLAHHYSLNMSEMGTGKSLMALATAKAAKGKVLVIGPRFLERVWEHEAKQAGVSINFIAYSMLHKYEPGQLNHFDFWIADECHALATPVTVRTVAFMRLFEQVMPRYFIGLSGTPIKSRVPQIWTLLKICGMDTLGTSGKAMTLNYHAFCRKFCVVTEMKIHNRIVTKFGGLKAGMMEEFRSYLIDKAIKFKVEEVLKDLPEMTYKVVPVEIIKVKDLAEEFEAYMNGKKVDAKAKALSACLKAPATAEYCNGLIEGNSGPLLVFTDHVSSAQLIHCSISGSEMITGATPAGARQRLVEEFQAGKLKALVATIGTMATGYTLTASRNVVFNDQSWVSSDNLQARKRIHRIGQKNACICHYIEASPTDAHINNILRGKEKNILEALG